MPDLEGYTLDFQFDRFSFDRLRSVVRFVDVCLDCFLLGWVSPWLLFCSVDLSLGDFFTWWIFRLLACLPMDLLLDRLMV